MQSNDMRKIYYWDKHNGDQMEHVLYKLYTLS